MSDDDDEGYCPICGWARPCGSRCEERDEYESNDLEE